MSGRFVRKVVVVAAVDIKGICYYEILAEIETINTVRYLEFLQRLIHCRPDDNGRHVVWSFDDSVW